MLRANRLSKRGEAASPPPLGPLDPPPTRNASLSRRRAGDGLERASPTLSLAQPDQVIIRTIDPTGPLLPGGRGALQLWWEDSDPASENRARAAYGLSRGKVGAKDPDEGEETFFLDDWGLGRPATRVTISKTRSGRPCVTLGVPHPMDKACGRP
ncbi:hypothetical protein [Rhodospirillum rubrum]|uniref:hypothetical protein n=1 Tax=Rhodospirillum rubrum TaxID=1085 RepID=UPI001F5E7972|nr:hypothetical protein [Rhodospirillum rubrum]